jgi:hypothetical protein
MCVNKDQKLKVMISMDLEGVTKVQPADEDFQYLFSVSQANYTHCGPFCRLERVVLMDTR